MDKSLRDYVAKQRSHGATDEQIRHALEANGWQLADINLALDHSGSSVPTGRQLLRHAMHEYGERFWTLLGITLVPGFVSLALVAIFGSGLAIAGAIGSSFGVLSAVLMLAALALIVVAVYIALWGQVALYVAIRDRHETIGLTESFRRARPLIVPFFTTSLWSGLLVIGGVFLFIVPGILFSLLFAFAAYVLVTDGTKNLPALMKSRDLVAGRLKTVVARLLFMGFIVWLCIAVLQFIVYAVGESLVWAAITLEIINSLLQLVVSPLMVVYMFLLFEALHALPPVAGVRSTEEAKRLIIRSTIAGYLLFATVVVFLLVRSL